MSVLIVLASLFIGFLGWLIPSIAISNGLYYRYFPWLEVAPGDVLLLLTVIFIHVALRNKED